jgi:hypothetical protein
MATAQPGPKPYIKLASTLVLLGTALFGVEQWGLGKFSGTAHLDGTMISILALAPIVLVLAGAVVFVVGRMRRL